jgi:hypothetical protein
MTQIFLSRKKSSRTCWKISSYPKFGIRIIVFNATFNNISVLYWRIILLVEETRVTGENHQPAASHRQTLSHNVVSSTHRHEWHSNSQR